MSWLSVALLSCVVARPPTISLTVEAWPRTLQLVDESFKDAFNPFNFSDVSDIFYQSSIMAGGAEFQVQLDSSDLWLDTENLKPSSTRDTGVATGVKYANRTVAQGPGLIPDVTFGKFTVPHVFIAAPGLNVTHNIDTGLLGVSPPKLSQTTYDLQSTAFAFNGATLLGKILATSVNELNYITFQLSRSKSLRITSGGTFTISAGFFVSLGRNATEDFVLGTLSFVTWTLPTALIPAFPEQHRHFFTTDVSTAHSEFDTLCAQRKTSITGSMPSSDVGGSRGICAVPRSMFSSAALLYAIGFGLGMALN
ncbi:hypothetical protein BD410DRAFT_842677 [Rickenella mellea]|uniref:Peptidase A1 domain-containing protein n=1 Tax=Rickenella mellea TaxID=50990 RepID=A0A4Y7PVM3_9AGAM|nr:hypothetical protein BD410DRAFT_842677 [Rickenella mellea]